MTSVGFEELLERVAANWAPFRDGDVSFDGMRALLAAQRALPVVGGAQITAIRVDGVPCEWVRAPGARRGTAVVHLHGGGYVMGDLASHRSFASYLSSAARRPVLVVDYRLAPEAPHPAALEDAGAVLRWATEHYPAGAVALTGDSAGGGLALAAAIDARDRGGRLPAALACISPWVDLACTGPSMAAQ